MAQKLTLQQEKALIEKARKDPESFGQIFDYYYNDILNYCLRRTEDVALAQDIASTVFFKAYKKLWQFKWQGVPFIAWLYRIANNEIKSHFRKSSAFHSSLDEMREEAGFEPSVIDDVEDEIIAAEEKLERHQQFLKVKEQMNLLDPKYQEVLQLRFFQKLKIDQIAQVLNKKPGTVKSLVSRGLSKLRHQVDREPEIVFDNATEPQLNLRSLDSLSIAKQITT